MLNPSTKLTKSQIKQLPAPVAQKVLSLQEEYRTRKCTLEVLPEGQGIYLGEDEDYYFFNLQGKCLSVAMDGEWSGYSKHPVTSAIGNRAPLPDGCYCVQFQLFLGHPFIRVYSTRNLLS